ncbi:transmembrane protein 187 [Biomphalaria glabrata]|nr:transmembrane protein 187 [Biomphalaria glabrata]
METFTTSAISILVPFSSMLILASSGFLDKVEHEIGLQYYAEPAWIPFISFMPFNTLINFAYIGYGLYWCILTKVSVDHGILKKKDIFMFYTFNFMCTVYGFVQLMRIITQTTFWAIMDQWCTLPFFSILFIWGLYYQHGWSSSRAGAIVLISLMSYFLSLQYKIGFEIALGLHIITAIIGAYIAYQKHRAADCMTSFYLAITFCFGFVVLKLLDHYLADIFILFRYTSGHFLSKICDVAQIACVNNFFFDLTLQKEADFSHEEKKKYFENYDNEYFQKGFTNDIMFEIVRRPKTNLIN